MAQVEKTKVTELVTEEKQVDRFVLTLDQEEAEVLSVVLAHVSGFPETSPRGTTDKIQYALRDAGIYFNSTKHAPRATGDVRFD